MQNKELLSNWKNQRNKLQNQAKTLVKNKVKLKKADALSPEVHRGVFAKFDCLQCGNCCKTIPPIVNQNDSARIANHLGIGLGEFMVNYMVIDDDGDTVMNASPCPFLNQENNECKIYEHRPRACRKYPHTDQNFAKHIDLHIQNINYCPAVFGIISKILESVK